MTEQLSPEALRQRVADLIAQHVSGPNLRALDVDPALHRLDQFTAARAIIPLIYTAGLRAGREEAAKVAGRKARQHRRYISNGRKLGLSDQATHNDHVMALVLRDLATAIRNLDKQEEGRDAG